MKNNWQILTSTIIAIVIMLLLSSCGVRKINNQKIDIKTDSIVVDNKRVLIQKNSFHKIMSIKPIDISKPIEIDGTKYYNSTITFDENKAITLKTKDEFKVIALKKDKKEKIKVSEKTDNTVLYIGLFLILCLFIYLKGTSIFNVKATRRQAYGQS